MKDIFLVDFDGTISKQDSTQTLAQEINPAMLKKYNIKFSKGEINVKKYVKDLLENLNVNEAEFRKVLQRKIEIDESFKAFVASNLDFRILSSGTEKNIQYVLEKYKIFIENEKIITNKIEFNGEKIKLTYPYHDSENGVNKADVVKNFQEANYRVIFVGDGASDYSASEEANIVFAKKDSSLARFCFEKNIEYFEFANFKDLLELYQYYC